MLRALVLIGFITLQSLIFVSCKKDTKIDAPVVEPKTTQVTFNYKAMLNNLPLSLGSLSFFTNQNGDSLNVSKFNYYISNIQLRGADGSVYKEPESYHLIQHVDASTTSFTIKNLPEGNYNQVEFLIGVDSARNVSGAQTGDLNPAAAMFWDWNSGYIFLKLEGKYKTAATPLATDYFYHIGGYCLPFNCIRKCTVLLSDLQVGKGTTPVVYYHVLVDEIFKTPKTISLDAYPGVSGGKPAQIISSNYTDMFVVDKIVN